MNKTVTGIYDSPQGHWVGDGFPVRNLFSYGEHGPAISPFLLLDYAGPARFTASARPRGVGEHPHRGFETVTIVYQGEVAHRDSVGNSGVIGPGDVQWMTAASGILHEEFHSPAFAQAGGVLEMVQLWVNLPAADKMSPPRYQSILNAAIPVVPLDAEAGRVRVIAGRYGSHVGPAATFSPLNVWDLRLLAGRKTTLTLPEGHIAAIVVLRGALSANGCRALTDAQFGLFGISGNTIHLEAAGDSTLLLLSGEPIAEPIVGHGPFVMNSRQEIDTAMRDFQAGKFGRMPVRDPDLAATN